MTCPNNRCEKSAKRILATVTLVFLLASTMLPLSTDAGSKTTKLADGKSEGTMEFLASGGTAQTAITLPYGAIVSNASIWIEGLPSISAGAVNYSKFYDYGPGTFVQTALNGDRVEMDKRTNWWNDTFHYRLEVQVNASVKARKDIVVTLPLNMTEVMMAYGISKDLDKDSIRVVEHKADGSFIVYNNSLFTDEAYLVPHRTTMIAGYDPRTNANITVDWTVAGTTPANTVRYYSIYFDTQDHWKLVSRYILKYFDDVIISNVASPKGYASAFFSNHTGPNPVAEYTLQVTSNYAGTSAVADLNKDGYLDITTPDLGAVTGAQASLYRFYGGANGDISSGNTSIQTTGARAVKAGDLNGDGWPDLVVACMANGGNYRLDSVLYYGSVTGFKTTPDFKFNTTGAVDVEILDYNGDGKLDVAFASMTNGATVDVNSTIFLQNATGGFKYEPTYNIKTYSAMDVSTGDLNGDELSDLAIANFKNNANNYDIDSFVYYGNKTGLSAPALVKGHGATGMALTDVDFDNRADIVMSNSGPPGNTDSYIYYNNLSGGYQVPMLKLMTDNASAITFGDTSGDGKTDLAFAQSSSPGSVSKIYVWCCSGFTETSKKLLPSEGAVSIAMGDMDRYHMDLDRAPPALTFSAMEGRYYTTGNYTSRTVVPNDRILSAVATWTSLAPFGSTVRVFLSNNGGMNWTQTQSTDGVIFDTDGTDLMFKVEFTCLVDTPSLGWFNLTYVVGGYPSDVTVDIGADGMDDWIMTGQFNYSYHWNTSALRTALGLHTRPDRYYPWENVTIPVVVSSNSSGMVRVYSINLSHDSPPYLKGLLPDVTFTINGQSLAAFDLDDYFGDIDGDSLIYTVQGNSSVLVRINTANTVDFWTKPGWSGSEQLTFVARDPDGGIAIGSMKVTVTKTNQPPKAVINRTPKTGITSFMNITFDGTNSTDPDGKIVQYLWSFDDGSYGVGPVVTHAYKNPDKGYNVALTVMDDGGLQATTTITVSVDNMAPVPKVSVVDNTGTGFDTGANILIDMAGTADKDGTISSFILDCGDGYVLRNTGTPPSVWEHAFKDGTYTYTISLQVTDDTGVSATARTTVRINNVGPVISQASAPASATLDQKVEFIVVAKDPDGTISKYMWDFEGTGDYKWTNSTTGNTTYKYSKTGTYKASLKIIDDDGKASFQTVTVKIKPPAENASLGLFMVVGIIALALAVLIIYYVLHQRSIILRQRDLLVKRDETLRALQKELSGEAAEEDKTDVDKPGGEEPTEVEEEDLGTLEPIEGEKPKAEPTPKETPKVEPAAATTGPIIQETSKPIFQPLESTGIMRETPPPPPPPPKSIAPKGLPDMMGAAQSTAVVQPPIAETPKEAPRPVPPKEEPKPVEEKKTEEPPKPAEKKVVAKARCPGCKALIPLYSLDRPMRMKCEKCGKEGVIK